MITNNLKKINLTSNLANIYHNGSRWVVYAILVTGSFGLHQTLLCQDITKIKASASGNINCVNTSVSLNCSVAGKGTIYKWTGPNGYLSTSKNPETAIPGKYIVCIINPETGITYKDSVIISIDTIPPREVAAASSGMLTCNNVVITLSGSSTTPGVEYQWQGPGNFESNEKNPAVVIPGIYTLTVTNPVNGCSVKTDLKVHQDIKPPEDVNATVSGVLTCNAQKVTLTGTSTTKGAEYKWTGQGLDKASRELHVSMPGIYEFEVTNPENGCRSKANVTVEQNIRPPAEVVATTSDTITCKINSVKLTASSTTKEAIFNWSGADGLTSSEHFLITSTPGSYTLQVTNPENGCSMHKTATVIKDINPPEDIKIISSGEITCSDEMVTLTCISSTSDVAYRWSGPDSFLSTSAALKVDKKGIYYVEATKISNGCSVTESFTVKENISYPKDVTASPSGIISCETPRVKLSGKSSTSKVNFAWTGPGGFISDLQEPGVNLPGKYTLTVTNPINDCKSETSVTVPGKVCKKSKNE
jgi:hypothetical protein